MHGFLFASDAVVLKGSVSVGLGMNAAFPPLPFLGIPGLCSNGVAGQHVVSAPADAADEIDDYGRRKKRPELAKGAAAGSSSGGATKAERQKAALERLYSKKHRTTDDAAAASRERSRSRSPASKLREDAVTSRGAPYSNKPLFGVSPLFPPQAARTAFPSAASSAPSAPQVPLPSGMPGISAMPPALGMSGAPGRPAGSLPAHTFAMAAQHAAQVRQQWAAHAAVAQQWAASVSAEPPLHHPSNTWAGSGAPCGGEGSGQWPPHAGSAWNSAWPSGGAGAWDGGDQSQWGAGWDK